MVKIEEIPSDDDECCPPQRPPRPQHKTAPTTASKPSPPPQSSCHSCCGCTPAESKDTPAASCPPAAPKPASTLVQREFYDLLGARPSESLAEIDAHYREKLTAYTTDEIIAAIRTKRGHSDMTSRLLALRNIIHAYKILSDQKTRERYDEAGEDVPSDVEETDPVEELRTKKPTPKPSPPVAVGVRVEPSVLTPASQPAKPQASVPTKKFTPEELAQLEEGVKVDFAPAPSSTATNTNTTTSPTATSVATTLRVDEHKRRQNEELRQKEQAYAEQRSMEMKRSAEERVRQRESGKEKQWEARREQMQRKLEEKGDDLLAFLDADRFGKKKASSGS